MTTHSAGRLAPDAARPRPGGGARADSAQWGPQVNLSRSGATSEPQIVVDSSGRYHVLWLDAFDGLRYTSGDGENWSQPTSPELPFATRRIFVDLPETSDFPTFNPGAHRRRREATSTRSGSTTSAIRLASCIYSRVPNGQFATYDAWSPAEVLAGGQHCTCGIYR